MLLNPRHLLLTLLLATLAACRHADYPIEAGMGPDPRLPEPDPTSLPVINIAPAVRWSANETPTPGQGLAVNEFAAELDHPRWLYVLPNGDVLVAETNAQPSEGGGVRAWVMKQVMERAGAAVPSPDRITLLRDADGDGRAEESHRFLENLTSPFGMVLVDNDLYVANTDSLMRYDYQEGMTRISGAGERLTDLPAGPINQHWTKNVVASEDGSTLYVAVGSNSNVADSGMENEVRRANVLAVDRQSGDIEVFASGLRNPVGMDFNPATGELWVAVNERDQLGGDLVPDYMTSVSEGEFFGWPWSYYGQNVDPRPEPNPDMVARAIAPDYALGAHTASLGLSFADGNNLPSRYAEGAFIGQHGSWNRNPPSGYQVIFVPFQNGRPNGMPLPVLTDFLDEDGDARGRPVGVTIDSRGDLLVADDVGNKIWRVSGSGR